MNAIITPLLREICNEPLARLIAFVRETYGVGEIVECTLKVSSQEFDYFSNERAVQCIVAAGTPAGEIVALRDPLGGNVRLPTTNIALTTDWRSRDWFEVLAEVRRRFQRSTGRELLLPEPVGLARLVYETVDSGPRYIEALVLTGLAGGQCQLGPEQPSFLSPLSLLDGGHRECAEVAAIRLKGMLPFPVEEAQSFSASTRFSRGLRNSARSVLRLTPQPHRKWLRRRLLSLIGDGSSAVDMAGGDDALMLDIGRQRPNACIFVNDLIWNEMDRIAPAARRAGITLLNHDVRSFPKCRFDVAVLKNCLHHLRRSGDQLAFLDTLPRIAGSVLIVEIEDPRLSALHGFWHRHIYTEDPTTDGNAFYTHNQFCRVLQAAFGSLAKSIFVDRVWAVRGSYVIAEVNF